MRLKLLLVVLLTVQLCSCFGDRDPDTKGHRSAIRNCAEIDTTSIDADLLEQFKRHVLFGTDAQMFNLLDAHPELICARLQSPKFGRISVLGYAVAHRSNLETGFEGLIQFGADPSSALGVAAETGKRRAVGWLLEAGAEPNADDAIISAVYSRDPDMVRSLLAAGADPNRPARPDGRYGNTQQTALHFAAFFGDIAIMELLIDAGADVDKQTTWGEPPLSAALDRERTAAIQLLVERGADLDRLDVQSRKRLVALAKQKQLTDILNP